MTRDEMIEAVARAIYNVDDADTTPWQERVLLSPGWVAELRREARAAILATLEAIREPSEAQLEAWVISERIVGPDELVEVPGTGTGDLAFYEKWKHVVETFKVATRYRAMIDALRKEIEG